MKQMSVSDILIHREWVLGALSRVIEEGLNDYSEDQIYNLLTAQRVEAWRDGDNLVVTQLVELSGGRICCLAYGSGDIETIRKMVANIEKLACERGVHRIRIIGRRGWLKALNGFREVHTVMEKDLWAIS